MEAKQSGNPLPSSGPRINEERIALLEEVGFVWSMRDRSHNSMTPSVPKTRVLWNDRFEELKAYKEEHGDCLVPRNYPPNPPLGVWVANQRTAYHCHMGAKQSGNPLPSTGPRINEERIALLEEVGFVWSTPAKSHNVPWNHHFEELKAYKNLHGNCLVPLKYPPNPPLGQWVSNQRAAYRHHVEAKERGTPPSLFSWMTNERISLLEELGFEARVRRDRNERKT